MMRQIITHSPEETIALAEAIGRLLRKGDVIAYTGELGAGKTTFTRGIARGMGLPDEVHSPTTPLYHFDMYRITLPEALESTGFYDYPLSDSVFAIEWSENIPYALPEQCLRIGIAYGAGDTRIITIEGDDRFADPGD